MSIFKETLDEQIQTQLQARTLVVSGKDSNRNTLLPWYLSKNSWVRMTSFVDYWDGKVIFDGKGKIETDKLQSSYKGSDLSKKYILQGGTLYSKTNGQDLESYLRKGLLSADGIYGGNIDVRTDGSPEPKYFRTLGIRPMPGITSVSTRTVSAYGSLFETTINFHAWDVNQLNELEVLFMRPGYSVLLEWGWSQYLTYDDKNVNKKSNLTNSDLQTTSLIENLNPFDNTLTPEVVYEKLQLLREKHRFNYDGMLGYVKNFNWKLRKDGGYDCSTQLISMGEALNSLKMSNSSNKTTDNDAKISGGEKYSYDDIENALISIKTYTEETVEGYVNDSGSFITEKSGTNPNIDYIKTVNESSYAGKWDFNSSYITKETLVSYLEAFGYQSQANRLRDRTPIYQEVLSAAGEDKNYIGTKIEYIPLDVLIALIASFSNLRIESEGGKTTTLVKIIPPESPSGEDAEIGIEDLCLAGEDTVSVNPNICTILNPGAFKTEASYIYFNSSLDKTKKSKGMYPQLSISDAAYYEGFEFYSKEQRAGRLANILINIDFALSTYKSLKESAEDDGVEMIAYFKNILKNVSNALGGLNNFILSTAGRDQNTFRIIDTYYLEKGKLDDKYEFDLFGLGSICKDVNIESQIFQEQSTIVAIAAQSKANLGDVYNSTQVYLNAGIEDRLARAKWQGEELDDRAIANKNGIFYRKLLNLLTYLRDYTVGHKLYQEPITTSKVYQLTQETPIPNTILKQALLRYDGELNFKALIPFKLKMTLEGISGAVVGQIFRVKNNVLPKNYYDKNIGFIVTGISHDLKNNDWETTLETQICLLDQDKFYENGKSKLTQNIDRTGFGDWIAKQQFHAILYPILIDYMAYMSLKSMSGFVLAAREKNKFSVNTTSILYDYNPNKNQETLKKYWIDNNLYYIGDGYSGGDKVGDKFIQTITTFDEFVKAWAQSYLQVASDDVLNSQFSITKTVRDVMTDISNQYYVSNATDETYLEFVEVVNQIKSFINANGKSLFTPGTSGATSVFGNQPFKPLFKEIVTQLPEVDNRIGAAGGFSPNRSTLRSVTTGYKLIPDSLIERIVSTFNNDENLKLLGDVYGANLTIKSGTSFNELFHPLSDVVYGNSNSLWHSAGQVWETGVLVNWWGKNVFNQNIADFSSPQPTVNTIISTSNPTEFYPNK